ncbi:hypothetical protein GCM10009784_23770 [Arthrobacter parietis]|uniref:PKD domain-containing protein n=1 Tax=Arthrobacter parietis TaxID=271434 RepID=A0ABP5MPP3_9MICC
MLKESIFRCLWAVLIVAAMFTGTTEAVAAEGDTKGILGGSDDVAVNSTKEASEDTPAGTGTNPVRSGSNIAAPVATTTITYSYERVCLQGVGSFLNRGDCVIIDAACDSEPDGAMVEWIAIDSSTTPPTETRTGDRSCLYPGSPAPEPPNGGEVAEPAVVITLEDFQSQPIIAAAVISEPNNFGLLGGHNNFWADVEEQEFAFETLGDQVRIRAWPVAYDWNYGDGTTRTTQTAGNAVPESDWLLVETPTSHAYGETGDYNLVLTTRFNGDYSVNGGPWIPIAGQAAVQSDPHLISIWRSDNRLVDGTCAENPSAWGC